MCSCRAMKRGRRIRRVNPCEAQNIDGDINGNMQLNGES